MNRETKFHSSLDPDIVTHMIKLLKTRLPGTLSLLAPGLFLVLLAGCSSYRDLPPGTSIEITSPVVERNDVDVRPFQDVQAPPSDYRVGAADILAIQVYGQPDLNSLGTQGGSSTVKGSRIDGDGYLHLPLVGAVQVAGLTLKQAEETLTNKYSRYLNDPLVVVEIVEHRSQPLNLLGQFNAPGVHYMERPLTLMEGLALGNGLNEIANLRGARLIRDNQTLAVDLLGLLQNGEIRNNVWLKAGDTIFVPDDRNQNVFVFGAVGKPGAIPMPNGNLTLAQALASAGVKESRDDESRIRIIRSHTTTRGELLVVDLGQVLRGKTLPFQLQQGDIVYVPRGLIGSWNQVLEDLLPSLQTVSAILQPFVQIEYLQNN